MIALNKIPVSDAAIELPEYGQWTAEVRLGDPGDGTFEALVQGGIATLSVDEAETMTGRVLLNRSQSVGLLGTVFLTAGAGAALSDEIPQCAYHDDDGVTTLRVLADILRDTGHTAATLAVSPLKTPGAHFARERAPAARVLTALLGRTWGFDLAGRFVVNPTNTDPAPFDIISYDGTNQSCVLALDSLIDPRGAMLDELGRSVQSCILKLDHRGIRAECQLGEVSMTRALEAIVEAIIARKVLAPVLYRVHSMGARGLVNLQPMVPGMPDLINVPQYPGIAGGAPTLVPGQSVVVQFLGHERTQPIITGYIGQGDGHVSSGIVFNESGATAARVDDPVAVGPFPGQLVTFGVPSVPPVPMMLGAPYPFIFSGAGGLMDPTKLNGVITDSDSSVKL